MKREVPKNRRGSDWNKDGAGRPVFRSKSWGEKQGKDPKQDRREWKKGVTYGN